MSTSIIRYNGGRPYKVVIDNYLSIFEKVDYDEQERVIYSDTPFYRISMEGKRVIPTEDPREDNTIFEPNNTMLVDMGDGTYLFIGCPEIFTFVPWEPIEHFYSPIGNSDVPYPWAQTKSYVYLMIEDNVEIPREDWRGSKSPYHYLYTQDRKRIRSEKLNYKSKTSKKVLHKYTV